MPALKQVAPIILKEILESAGWTKYNESRYNWSMVNAQGASIEISRNREIDLFRRS